MRLKILLAIVSSFLFSACAGLPDRPDVLLCTMDLPREQAICVHTIESVQQTEDLHLSEIERSIQTLDTVRIPLNQLDKYIMYSPADWEQIANYIGELKALAKTRCE